jgi:alpha-glucosidase
MLTAEFNRRRIDFIFPNQSPSLFWVPMKNFTNVRLVAWKTAVFVILILLPPGVTAQWSGVGALERPERTESGLLFRGKNVTLSVTAVSTEIVRIRLARGNAFGRDHSYAVVPQQRSTPRFSARPGETESQLETDALRVVVKQNPFHLEIFSENDDSLDADDPVFGTAFTGGAGSAIRTWKRLRDDEYVYGFGEKTGRLNKRGQRLGGYNYVMWNSDVYAYDASTDPLYSSIPFFIVLRKGRAHGIFLDNTFRSAFDVGHTSAGALSFGADGGELNYYFIDGPSPKEVIRRYTELTGRMPLPPLWALGYHQSRYSYYPESQVRYIANSFRERRIPADVIWLDIHYQDGFKPFTWDHDRFPDPAGLIRDLRNKGFRVVTIVDSHPKKEPGYAPYDEGLAGGHFVKNPDGSIYEAPAWPSLAQRNPGPSVFPDFSRPATREWWGGLYKPFIDLGVAGIWNDMGEPTVFVYPSSTFPLTVRHDNEGQPTDHREIHNVYGLLMSRATYEGLRRLRPDDRAFVLTRATFAGGQRYAALWTGDNVSNWTSLAGSIPTLAGLGVSGLPFVGADIGGYAGAPSAELYTRWLQAGVFYPFMRTHTEFGTPPQEPWSYGATHEAINRSAIELRYELLPYIYNVMREASVTGLPALRPTFLEFPEDQLTYELDTQFMFGDALLVAPVVEEGARRRSLYLPKGIWFDYWTGTPYEGARVLTVDAPLSTIPVFVRGGRAVFTQPVVQNTGEINAETELRVTLYPAPAGETARAELYEDDGRSMAYQRGDFSLRNIEWSESAEGVRISLRSSHTGTNAGRRSNVVIRFRTDTIPRAVKSAAVEIPRVADDAWNAVRPGWRYRNGFVEVRLPAGATTIDMSLLR